MARAKKTELTGVKEIARRAGVAIATVDRVIHNRSGVSEKTREKINRIIKELNYQPNIMAQRLSTRKVFRLATLIPAGSEETSFWDAPLNGIDQAYNEIRNMGVSLEKYFYDQNERSSFVKAARKILKDKPDGMLLAPTFIEESVEFTEKCKAAEIPYVLIDSDLPNEGSLSYMGPDLYQSGYLSAHLISYLVKQNDSILVVNISREIGADHHLMKKEKGFRAFFEKNNKPNKIVRADIHHTDYRSIKRTVAAQLSKLKTLSAVFVTNSRVADVARVLEETGKNPLLVGFDYLPNNIDYLKRSVIDFLICQQPQEQGYRGVMALYQHLALSLPVEKLHFMPIDIITSENYIYYRN